MNVRLRKIVQNQPCFRPTEAFRLSNGAFWLRPLVPIYEDERRWSRFCAWSGTAFIVFVVHAAVVIALIRTPKPGPLMDQPPPMAVMIDLDPISTAEAAERPQEAQSKKASRKAVTRVADQIDDFNDPTKTTAPQATRENTWTEKLPDGTGPAKLPSASQKAKKLSLAAKEKSSQKKGPAN